MAFSHSGINCFHSDVYLQRAPQIKLLLTHGTAKTSPTLVYFGNMTAFTVATSRPKEGRGKHEGTRSISYHANLRKVHWIPWLREHFPSEVSLKYKRWSWLCYATGTTLTSVILHWADTQSGASTLLVKLGTLTPEMCARGPPGPVLCFSPLLFDIVPSFRTAWKKWQACFDEVRTRKDRHRSLNDQSKSARKMSDSKMRLCTCRPLPQTPIASAVPSELSRVKTLQSTSSRNSCSIAEESNNNLTVQAWESSKCGSQVERENWDMEKPKVHLRSHPLSSHNQTCRFHFSF